MGAYFAIAGGAEALKIIALERAEPEHAAWLVRASDGALWRVSREGDGWVGIVAPPAKKRYDDSGSGG